MKLEAVTWCQKLNFAPLGLETKSGRENKSNLKTLLRNDCQISFSTE